MTPTPDPRRVVPLHRGNPDSRGTSLNWDPPLQGSCVMDYRFSQRQRARPDVVPSFPYDSRVPSLGIGGPSRTRGRLGCTRTEMLGDLGQTSVFTTYLSTPLTPHG